MERSHNPETWEETYKIQETGWDETALEETSDELEDLLWNSSSQAPWGPSFWSFNALCRVLTRDRVLQALQSCRETFKNTDELESYIDRIRPVYGKAEDVPNSMVPCKPSSEPKRCLKLLAVLVLMDRTCSIKQFIDEGINDDDLPLKLPNITDRKRSLGLAKQVEEARKADKCFRRWRSSALEIFDQFQFRVNVPFFDYQQGQVLHYDLPARTVLPWISLETADMDSAGGVRLISGGEHGQIRQVRIEPSSHNFHELSSAVSISDIFSIPSSRYFIPQSSSKVAQGLSC